MCGIAGLIHPQAGTAEAPRFDAEIIRAMTAALRHRGPDGDGFFETDGLALGHRRLAVVDLAGGSQPMTAVDREVWVSFNGEIYNHLQLRRQLESAGYSFRTRSDTEVLVQGFRHWGPGLTEHLEGQFAFAVWDGRDRRLWLFRDRMGQKPLFYASLPDGSLAFASEAKALVTLPGVSPAVDEEALAHYLTFEYLPADRCMFRGITKLPPAHRLSFQGGTVALERYWRLPLEEHHTPWPDAVEQFRVLFDQAVERRLMADVPLGIFLSGGLDSSCVAASAVRAVPASSVRTFSIGFDDPSFDESRHASLVAEHLGTDHHSQVFSVESVPEVLPRITAGLDEPFGDASLLPTYLLSDFTRQKVTVALGGDGGDELLLGYPTFLAERFAGPYRRLPRVLRAPLEAVIRGLPVDARNFSLEFVLKSFIEAAHHDPAIRHALWLGSVVPGSPDDPLHQDLRSRHGFRATLAPALAAWHRADDTLSALSRYYCETYLAEDILHKVDRASMAVSLEARTPFLDRDFIEFVARLPRHYKLRGLRGKHILKRAFEDRLPRSIPKRKKKGFGIPMARWLRGPLSGLLDDLLSRSRIAAAGFFQPDVVDRLVTEHRDGSRDHRKTLWTLISFELWRERYGIVARS